MHRAPLIALALLAAIVALPLLSRGRPAPGGDGRLELDIAIPDAEEVAAWQAQEGSVRAVDGTLEWTADRPGATIGRHGVPSDWTGVRDVRLRLHCNLPDPFTFEVQARMEKGGRFWRKIAVEGAGWHTVVVPLYQFRRTGAPRWDRVSQFVLSARQPGRWKIDSVALVPSADGEDGRIEPDGTLIRRAFPGSANARLYRNARFRVASEYEIDGDRLLRRLDELHDRFRQRLGLDEEAGPPATLVIFREPEAYRQFCAATARDVYAASLGPVTAEGYTFLDYSVSYWSEARREDRPVYVHELCHQLISRCLRIEEDQKWVQEGFATLMQWEMLASDERAEVAEVVRRLGNGGERIPLASLDARFMPKTGQYVQLMSLVAYLMTMPEWPVALAAIQRGSSLREVVEGALRSELSEFEVGWLAFCRGWNS